MNLASGTSWCLLLWYAKIVDLLDCEVSRRYQAQDNHSQRENEFFLSHISPIQLILMFFSFQEDEEYLIMLRYGRCPKSHEPCYGGRLCFNVLSPGSGLPPFPYLQDERMYLVPFARTAATG